MKLLFNLLMFFFLAINIASAQENCKVSVDALKGTYEGECAGGKANGKGKAVGLDAYEGEFKNGFPEGTGTYTWADKSTYTGGFKKGFMDGKGELKYTTTSGADTMMTGYWKKNKYIGMYEKPFVINDRTGRVSKLDITISDKHGKGAINLTSTQLSSASLAIQAAAPVVTDIVVLSGQYISKNTSSLSNSSVLRIQQMIFPFRARFQFSNGEMVDITFYEKSDYEVSVAFL